MVKTLKIFFSGTKWPMTLKVGMLHWVLKYYQLCSNDNPELTLTFFMARSNLVSYAFVWEKGKTMYFSDIITVYNIKVCICSALDENMKLYEYQRSRSFTELGQKVSKIQHFQTSFP